MLAFHCQQSCIPFHSNWCSLCCSEDPSEVTPCERCCVAICGGSVDNITTCVFRSHLLESFTYLVSMLDYHACYNPVNTRRWTNVVLKLTHRLRRWPNYKTTLVQCLMFAGEVTCVLVWALSMPDFAYVRTWLARRVIVKWMYSRVRE